MPKILIGRNPSSQYRVSDPTVSRRHAEIDYRSKDYISCTDLGSRNGTYVLRKRDWVRLDGVSAIKRTDQLRFGAAKVFVADIIADAKLPETAKDSPDEPAGEPVAQRRELNRPRRNIATGEVEES